MSTSRSIDMRRAWNQISAGYQGFHQLPTDAAHYGPFLPSEAELRLLGDVRGQRILELGCGGGQCSIAFARAGAHAVGLDLSDAQVDFARQLAAAERLPVEFVQGDAADLRPFADASFDLVFSAYALQYIEPVAHCLAEVARVLRAGGRLVFSLDHPLRSVFWDDTADEDTLLAVRSYWQRGAMDWQWHGSTTWMRSFHHTVGDWVDLLHAAGLALQRIVEPEPALNEAEAISWAESYDLEMVRLIPQTIIFVAGKAA